MKQKLTSECAQAPAATGIVHFWELPQHLHVVLKASFRDRLMRAFMRAVDTKYAAKKFTGIHRITLSEYINNKNQKMRIDFLIKILAVVAGNKFTLDNAEKTITWIGDFRSHGIINPRLPFDFNSRAGARFLAAICNDGWISDGAYYSNTEEDLRDSVRMDTLSVFGGNESTVHEWLKEKDQYLSFPSVIRDALCLITRFKGIKSENNPLVPSFILKSKSLMCGWLEQTIADEGCVKHYLHSYRRELNWSRAFQKSLSRYNLLEDEKKMLNQLGVIYQVYTVGKYKTARGVNKVRFAVRIAKRENLLKLRELLRIPSARKDTLLTRIAEDFNNGNHKR